MSTEDRKTVAQELAAKGGQDWEKLSPEMVNAYLHNADLVIEERNRPPVDELNPKPMYTCDRCQDTAYIGGKRCGECNPMGLPVKQVHPKIVDEMPVVSISGGIPEGMEVGESITTTSKEDEETKAKAEQEAEEVKRTRELKPTEYRCSKCSKPGKTVIHRSVSTLGKKHLAFVV